MAGRTRGNAIDISSDSDGELDWTTFIEDNNNDDGFEPIQRLPRRRVDPGLLPVEEGGEVFSNDVERQRVPDSKVPSNIVRASCGTYETCLAEIRDVLPDISLEFFKDLYEKQITAQSFRPEGVIVAQTILDIIFDQGSSYPKEKDNAKQLKRKRSDKQVDEDEAARWRLVQSRGNPQKYRAVALLALKEVFVSVPTKYIDQAFKDHQHYYGAYFAILQAERGLVTNDNPPYARLKYRRTNSSRDNSTTMLEEFESNGFDLTVLKDEMHSALQRRLRDDSKLRAAETAKAAEERKEQDQRAIGQVMECGCCYDDVAFLKLTHCNGEGTHYFCLDCAKRNAETDIGHSRYALHCMTADCPATFSREQRKCFLDEKTIEKLERLQQQDEIRKANLLNLGHCPFCDFVAICPTVEEDREFRCANPDCEEISCRLCKLKSHIPLSCEEYQKECGVSERRIIEEARTEALIRTCKKCKIRILKEDGCNKVCCTGCRSMICDYCGEDITKVSYNHFDGQGRVPPGLIQNTTGKCPLYDDEGVKRKENQVNKAEKDALAKVRAEHPELSEEDLKIRFAKSVQSPAASAEDFTGHHPHAFHHLVNPAPVEQALNYPFAGPMPQFPQFNDGLDPAQIADYNIQIRHRNNVALQHRLRQNQPAARNQLEEQLRQMRQSAAGEVRELERAERARQVAAQDLQQARANLARPRVVPGNGGMEGLHTFPFVAVEELAFPQPGRYLDEFAPWHDDLQRDRGRFNNLHADDLFPRARQALPDIRPLNVAPSPPAVPNVRPVRLYNRDNALLPNYEARVNAHNERVANIRLDPVGMPPGVRRTQR